MPGPLLTPVLDVIEARGGFEHSLRRMVVFSALPSCSSARRAARADLAHGFGSTEQGAVTNRLLPTTSTAIRSGPRASAAARRRSSTWPSRPDGNRLEPNEIGELGVRSAMSLGGDWGLEEAYAQAFFDGDWFRPRDVGYLDDDGVLYYADRAGDEIETAKGVVCPHYVGPSAAPRVGRGCGVAGSTATSWPRSCSRNRAKRRRSWSRRS